MHDSTVELDDDSEDDDFLMKQHWLVALRGALCFS